MKVTVTTMSIRTRRFTVKVIEMNDSRDVAWLAGHIGWVTRNNHTMLLKPEKQKGDGNG